MISANLLAVFYLISGVLFILALRGLSSPETSRQGNLFGIIGMAIAISVTIQSLEKTLNDMKGKEFSKFKDRLSDALVAEICPVGKKIKDLNNKIYEIPTPISFNEKKTKVSKYILDLINKIQLENS